MNFLTNFIFLIFSFLTFLTLIFNNIKEAKYLILFDKKNFVDNRCKIYFTRKDLNRKNLYFCRCFNLKIGWKFYLNFKNLIFINSFFYFFGSKSHYIIYKLLNLTRIEKIQTIDDYRYVEFFSQISKGTKIKCLGYMHGRFSKHLSNQKNLFKYNFDTYFVWSKYFKEKIIKLNKHYNEKNVFIKKPAYIKRLSSNKTKVTNIRKTQILYIEEKSVPFYTFKEVYSLIKNNNKLRIIYKFRPNESIDIKKKNFLINNKIKFFHKKNIFNIYKSENIKIIFATNSTLVIFAPLFGIFPVSLKSKYVLKDYIQDKLIFFLDKKKNFNLEIFKTLKKKKQLNKMRRLIWN